jgi:OOP family OmpA-OmpF porin
VQQEQAVPYKVPFWILLWAAVFTIPFGPAVALNLAFPGSVTATASTHADLASYHLPTGPWRPQGMDSKRVEGATERTAWRIDAPGISTLAILAALRAQLAQAGFQTVFECETEGCGGFDFRFDVGIMPEPDMHVDLGDFRFLSAERKTAKGADVVSLMVSRSSLAGFVQMTLVTAGETAVAVEGQTQTPKPDTVAITVSTSTNPSLSDTTNDIGARLLTGGAITLEGLEFASGATALTEGRYPSLASLAEWLQANPEKSVALVGHTDASGALDVNVSLSQRRAASVRKRLIENYGIPATQLEAQGVGYLSPRDTNLTEDGRTNNRRVEAILTSTR